MEGPCLYTAEMKVRFFHDVPNIVPYFSGRITPRHGVGHWFEPSRNYQNSCGGSAIGRRQQT